MNFKEAYELMEQGKFIKRLQNGWLLSLNDGYVEVYDDEDGWNYAYININDLIKDSYEEYIIEPNITIPRDTPMDTLILVSTDGLDWKKRYFKCFGENEEIIAWIGGCTSFTAPIGLNTTSWKYAKLPENEV